ncbi:MAG: lipopolysaccharide kinase [Flavobacteriaceae bacterium]|nr:lipopolysaccharide kinase [Flavobacteriaceae bacterium]
MKETFVIHPNYSEFKTPLKEVLNRFSEVGEYMVKGDRNTIKKMEIDGTIFSVKKFKTPNVFQSLVYRFLRKSKARRSFEYADRLISLGVGTPHPVAYLERFSFGLKDSYYICLHMDYDFDFRTLNHNPKWPNRNEILKQFAAFTFQLHEKGILFLDHSPGNTLINEVGEKQYEFYLIDLNRMRFRSLNFQQRMRNFRRMWLSKTMINVMAPVYAELQGTPEDKTHLWMSYYSRKFQTKINSKKLRRKKRKQRSK